MPEPTKAEVHAIHVWNGADGNDGVGLQCSCRWECDLDRNPPVEKVAEAAAAHRADADGAGGEPRRVFKHALRVLGFAALPYDPECLSRKDVRVFIGWQTACLVRGDGGGVWDSFETVIDVAIRIAGGLR